MSDVRKVSAGAGAEWLLGGFGLLRKAPAGLLATGAVLGLVTGLPLLLAEAAPGMFLGLQALIMLLTPVLLGGFVFAMHQVDRDGAASPAHLLEGFRNGRTLPLMAQLVPQIAFGIAAVLLLVLMAVVPALLLALYSGFEQRANARREARSNAQRIARHAAADAADHAQQHRREGRQPECQRLAGTHHREQCQPRRIEQLHRVAQAFDQAVAVEGDQPGDAGKRQVGPVRQRGRRRADQHVAHDAADARRRPLIRLDVGGVVMALHLEDGDHALADVDHAGVLTNAS